METRSATMNNGYFENEHIKGTDGLYCKYPNEMELLQ